MAERRLGNRLKETRVRLALTQAKLVGVSRKTVNTIENSVFIASTILALALSRALNMRVEDLFFLVEGQ